MRDRDLHQLKGLLYDRDWSTTSLDDILSDDELAILSLDLEATETRRRVRSIQAFERNEERAVARRSHELPTAA